MNSRHAEYIMTILKEGSFTAAAKKLYLSQPSLSQIVKSAEHSLGMPIFDRTTVPLTLTPAGELYIRAAQQIAQITENLDREIQELQEKKRGCIHIGIPIQRAAKIVPYLYGAFSREYPQVQLDFHECGSGDLEKSILENNIDFAFLATTPQNPALTYECCWPTKNVRSQRDLPSAPLLTSKKPKTRFLSAAKRAMESVPHRTPSFCPRGWPQKWPLRSIILRCVKTPLLTAGRSCCVPMTTRTSTVCIFTTYIR